MVNAIYKHFNIFGRIKFGELVIKLARLLFYTHLSYYLEL